MKVSRTQALFLTGLVCFAVGGKCAWWSSDGTLMWRYEIGIPRSGNPAPAIAVDGTVYVGSGSGYLYAINPDGTLRWRYETGDRVGSAAIADDGTIYVNSNSDFEHHLYAINPDGSLKWRYRTERYVTTDAAIAEDGTVYVGSRDSCLYAINPDGTLKWRYQTEGPIQTAAAIAEDGTVYVGSGYYVYYLYALNLDGSLKWRYRPNSLIWAAPAIADNGTVYIWTIRDGLYAINPDGTLKWQYEDAGTPAVIGPDHTIYVGSSFHERTCLFALNPDGTLRWQYKLPEAEPERPISTAPPVVTSDGTAYVSSYDGFIYAIKDGRVRWRFEPSHHAFFPAVGEDGSVYFVADGYLYAIRGSGPLADSPWPKYQRDNRNTGRALSAPRTSSSITTRLANTPQPGHMRSRFLCTQSMLGGHRLTR